MTDAFRVEQARGELAEDHQRLRALVDEIRTSGARELALERLSRLHEQLVVHFNLEEKPGGLYDALGVCVPEFRRSLARLVDDHFRLAATARDLRERARQPWQPGADLLPADVVRFAEALADHEVREARMVEEALARGGRARGEAERRAAPAAG